jgi:hypothetical protein
VSVYTLKDIAIVLRYSEMKNILREKRAFIRTFIYQGLQYFVDLKDCSLPCQQIRVCRPLNAYIINK